MHLSDHGFRQLDDADLETPAQARALLGKALADLKAKAARALIIIPPTLFSLCVADPL